ncbi:MAG: hypothetical protein AAGM67_21405 [Bacteroidota bacterium]
MERLRGLNMTSYSVPASSLFPYLGVNPEDINADEMIRELRQFEGKNVLNKEVLDKVLGAKENDPIKFDEVLVPWLTVHGFFTLPLITDLHMYQWQLLLNLPLQKVDTIQLKGTAFFYEATVFKQITDSDWITNVKEISLSRMSHSDLGPLREFLKSPKLSNVEKMSITNSSIQRNFLDAFESSHLSNLKTLNIVGSELETEDLPYIQKLREYDSLPSLETLLYEPLDKIWMDFSGIQT